MERENKQENINIPGRMSSCRRACKTYVRALLRRPDIDRIYGEKTCVRRIKDGCRHGSEGCFLPSSTWRSLPRARMCVYLRVLFNRFLSPGNIQVLYYFHSIFEFNDNGDWRLGRLYMCKRTITLRLFRLNNSLNRNSFQYVSTVARPKWGGVGRGWRP